MGSGEDPMMAGGGIGGLRGLLCGPLSRLGLGVAAATFLADQGSKTWLLSVYDLASKGRVELLSFLDLVYVINPGISYGLLPQGSATGQVLLALFALAASIALAYWIARAGSRLLAVSLGLVLGGALGNGLDRLLIGGVSDFVSLHAGGYYWYVFNVADAAIVAGVIGLLYDSLFGNRDKAAKSS